MNFFKINIFCFILILIIISFSCKNDSPIVNKEVETTIAKTPEKPVDEKKSVVTKTVTTENYQFTEFKQSQEKDIGHIAKYQIEYSSSKTFFGMWEEGSKNGIPIIAKRLVSSNLDNENGHFDVRLISSSKERNHLIESFLSKSSSSKKIKRIAPEIVNPIKNSAIMKIVNPVGSQSYNFPPNKSPRTRKIEKHCTLFAGSYGGYSKMGPYKRTNSEENDYSIVIKGGFFESADAFNKYLSSQNEIVQNFERLKQVLKNKEIDKIDQFIDQDSKVYFTEISNLLANNSNQRLDQLGQKYKCKFVTKKIFNQLSSKKNPSSLSLNEIIYHSKAGLLNLDCEDIENIEFFGLDKIYKKSMRGLFKYYEKENNKRARIADYGFIQENDEWKLNIPSTFKREEKKLEMAFSKANPVPCVPSKKKK